jgi:hypothetical protein
MRSLLIARVTSLAVVTIFGAMAWLNLANREPDASGASQAPTWAPTTPRRASAK